LTDFPESEIIRTCNLEFHLPTDSLPPLAALRAFEATARHLSFSAAARELNVTHVAVGQQVRRLEQHLGAVLVVRTGRGVELTADGARLAARLVEGFDLVRAALAEFAAASGERPLRVTLTPMFAATWLMPRLAEFRAEQPQIELMLNPSPDLIDLRREDYDLAIRFGTGAWPGLEIEPFIASGFVVVAAPSVVKGKRVETPADLASLPWVLQDGSDEFDVWLATHGVQVAKKHDVTHLPGYMLLAAAREGQGAALASKVLVEDDLRTGRLIGLFEDADYRGTSAGYYLVRRPGPMRPPLRHFVRWLKRAAKREAV
jgi:LysR family glycine cleavage system transcriptional activator